MGIQDSEKLVTWVCNELTDLLGFPATEDIAQYLLSMENRKDLEEYLQSMLDMSNPSHQSFVEQFMFRLSQRQTGKTPAAASRRPEQLAKNNPPRDSGYPKAQSAGKDATKKAKQVPLYSAEGTAKDVATLPGRHKCECQASKHELVNNCLKCGRVVCRQEGAGPCFFCGNLVYTKEDAEVLARGSKKSEQLLNKLLNAPPVQDTKEKTNAGLDRAVAHKNKLLEFDRTCERRTQVIDDESDYFNANNKWLSSKERELLQKRKQELLDKRHASKRDVRITLDFAGRRVVEEKDVPEANVLFSGEDEVLKAFAEKQSINYFSSKAADEGSAERSPAITRPVYEPTDSAGGASGSSAPASFIGGKMRLQDRELQQMSDEGRCLSMHQPYASLLVAGIKRHEGRTWYSAHRGRLWIASTARPVQKEEIDQLENFYRIHYKDDTIRFPSQYPSGCLLGCVDVVNVLPQEEYRKEFPDGESESPFVFICENPHELLVKFPIKGQHKIYKLEAHIHQAAKKSIRY